ncbi:hypothetical protein [Paenibacillus periandrae]|uniref:hypothetical protein n=1 Tax=Paenibacillus periandrae TaxID=1761741 RepID=UPI001F097E1E|nr:hypothetical protein [Paenibacillus periandrae]
MACKEKQCLFYSLYFHTRGDGLWKRKPNGRKTDGNIPVKSQADTYEAGFLAESPVDAYEVGFPKESP